jgi:hypothetical protein
MNKSLIHRMDVVVNDFLGDCFHCLQILYLQPTLHQIHTDLVYGIFNRSILWLVRRRTNNTVPALPHGLVTFRRLVQG